MINFIIGTEAELIKVFPIMVGLKKRGVEYNFIATGQHDLSESEILKIFQLKKPDYILYSGPQFTSIFRLIIWFLRMVNKHRRNEALFSSEQSSSASQSREGIVVVHGDTVSTLLGVALGRIHGLKVAHLETGLRSFNLLDPFPEEITRRLVTQFSTIYFCPNSWAYDNLKKDKDKIKINLGQNTLLDSYQLIKEYLDKKDRLKEVKGLPEKYFVFVLHRTETLYFFLNKNLVANLLKIMVNWSKHINAVFVLHHTTAKKLSDYGFKKDLKKEKKVLLLGRQSYPDFMRILNGAEFIITDGGSNQEECYYSGIPTLLIRKNTERIEGLGKNVVLSHLNFKGISSFLKNYKKYKHSPLEYNLSPSEVVIDYLIKLSKD